MISLEDAPMKMKIRTTLEKKDVISGRLEEIIMEDGVLLEHKIIYEGKMIKGGE